MADRSTLRIVFTPFQTGGASVWFNLLLKPFASKPKITGFGQIIQSFHHGEEACAFAMYAGYFSAAGETIESTPSLVFEHQEASNQWHGEMHTLAWLHHFTASNRKLHAHYALRLLARWDRASKPELSTLAHCKVMVALATDGAALARTVDASLQREFFAVVARHAFKLSRRRVKTSSEAVLKAASILMAATAFQGLEGLQKQGTDSLEANIQKIVLADGGHISRKPKALLELISILAPLKSAMKKSRQVFPPKASQSLDRMMAMLVTLRHGDGGVAGLDPTKTHLEDVHQCLQHDDSAALPLVLAQQSEVARLSKGKLCLIAQTKAGFEFELSSGEHRILKCRSEFHDQSVGNWQINDAAAGIILQNTEGNLRQRTYFLSDCGRDLRIEDDYHGTLELVFDMAQDMKVTALRESKDLLLILPNRDVWKLSMRGAEARIEQNGKILRLLSTGKGRINWALKQQIKSAKSNQRKKDVEHDILI